MRRERAMFSGLKRLGTNERGATRQVWTIVNLLAADG
jgi:hypothetical protein